jgi:hypothetical protein
MQSTRVHRKLVSRLLAAGTLLALAAVSPPSFAEPDITIDAKAWRIVARESGPVNYYAQLTEPPAAFVRSRYVPPMKTAVLGWQTPDADRRKARKLRWSWRAQTRRPRCRTSSASGS